MGTAGTPALRAEGAVRELAGISFQLLNDDNSRSQAEALFAGAGLTASAAARRQPTTFLLGAYDGDRLVGAAESQLGPDDARPARVNGDRLRVVNLAVKEESAGVGIGGALMRLLRIIAVHRGLHLVTWEQEVLNGRLAHLAIHKLGAVSRGLSPERGGRMAVEWWVNSPRVRSRLGGSREDLDLAHVLEAGTPKLNTGRLGEDGLLRPVGEVAVLESASALVEVPYELHLLRQRDTSLATEWHRHVTDVLSSAFAQGYWLTDYLCLRGERYPRAYYLLIDGERTLG